MSFATYLTQSLKRIVGIPASEPAQTSHGLLASADAHSDHATEIQLREFGLMEKPAQADHGGGCVVGAVRGDDGSPVPVYDLTPNPLLAVGTIATGKTAGLMVPTLLSWRGSAVVHERRTDISLRTAIWRSSDASNRVLQFDPSDLNSPDRYNPISAIRLATQHAWNDADHLADCLISCTPKLDYLQRGAMRLAVQNQLLLLILCAAYHHASLSDVGAAIEGSASRLLLDYRPLLTAHPEIADRFEVIKLLIDVCPGDDVDRAILIALEDFLEPVAAVSTSQSTFTLEDLANAEQPWTLYLQDSALESQAAQGVHRVLLAQMIRRLAETQKDHRLLMLLDEFLALGRMPFFERAIPTMVDHGIKLCLCVQDLHDLTNAYGATVLRHFPLIVALRARSFSRIDHFSELTAGRCKHLELASLADFEARIVRPDDGETLPVRLCPYYMVEPFRMRARTGLPT